MICRVTFGLTAVHARSPGSQEQVRENDTVIGTQESITQEGLDHTLNVLEDTGGLAELLEHGVQFIIDGSEGH